MILEIYMGSDRNDYSIRPIFYVEYRSRGTGYTMLVPYTKIIDDDKIHPFKMGFRGAYNRFELKIKPAFENAELQKLDIYFSRKVFFGWLDKSNLVKLANLFRDFLSEQPKSKDEKEVIKGFMQKLSETDEFDLRNKTIRWNQIRYDFYDKEFVFLIIAN